MSKKPNPSNFFQSAGTIEIFQNFWKLVKQKFWNFSRQSRNLPGNVKISGQNLESWMQKSKELFTNNKPSAQDWQENAVQSIKGQFCPFSKNSQLAEILLDYETELTFTFLPLRPLNNFCGKSFSIWSRLP